MIRGPSLFLSSPTFTLSSSPVVPVAALLLPFPAPMGNLLYGDRRTRCSSLRSRRLIKSSDVVNTGSWVSTLVLDPTRLSNRRFVSR
ncbi:BnaUnng00600D [Brassica napus]|uniref:Uncharacterized protein n=3 Tax=Brassica TaxID=3705 RepID=A0A0D3E9K7_BRAOL|nr:unnamed protein product [Brassica napus]CDY55825.1 BnaUnng00600D [Brassica napus]VDD31393.1 unnamed protein product [Brassica oleracea]